MRAVLLMSLLSLAGCSSSEPPKHSVTERRLQVIAQMFNRYTARHQGRTPPNEKAFKDFINAISNQEKTALDITSVDELLVSSNDNKPFIIRYGMAATMPTTGSDGFRQAPGKGPPPSSAPAGPGGGPGSTQANRQNLFAAEASGTKRFVVFATGQVEQLQEVEVLKLLK